jgi:hypothetical protein
LSIGGEPRIRELPSHAPDQDEIAAAGVQDGLEGNGLIEGSKPAVIPDSQTQQINIRDLLVSGDHRMPKQHFVSQSHGIFPEVMIRIGTKRS